MLLTDRQTDRQGIRHTEKQTDRDENISLRLSAEVIIRSHGAYAIYEVLAEYLT